MLHKVSRFLCVVLTTTFALLALTTVPSGSPSLVGPWFPCELQARWTAGFGALEYTCRTNDACPAPSLCDLVSWDALGTTFHTCACDMNHSGDAQPPCWSIVDDLDRVWCTNNLCTQNDLTCVVQALNQAPGVYLTPCLCQ